MRIVCWLFGHRWRPGFESNAYGELTSRQRCRWCGRAKDEV